MTKSDKELTVEIVNTFVNSWNAADRTSAIQSNELQSIIKDVYQTIKGLD